MNWTEISLEINADDIDKAAAIANMTVPYGISVSYTHLDVYKRQGVYRTDVGGSHDGLSQWEV